MFYKPSVLTSAFILFSTPAMTSNVSTETIEEVIVSATKINKNISKVGSSISLIPGKLLSDTDSAEDLSQYLSGVQTAVSNGSQATFQIRGIGAVDHQALTPTAAAIYHDGIYLASNVQTSPMLFDLERAEVLKGPQGSLYGRNASAGAINFISVRPSDTKTGYIEGGFGRFNRLNINGAINTPLTDKLSVRLSGRFLSQDPMLENIVTNDTIAAPKAAAGERDEFGLRAMALLNMSPDSEILFTAHYSEDNGINPAPINSSLTDGDGALGKHEISVGPDGVQDTDNEFYGSSIQANHKFGDYALTLIAGYEGYNQQYGFDFDGSPAPFNVPSLNANLAYDRDFSQYSLEGRLSYVTDTVEMMAGLYLDSENFEQEYLIWCGDLDTTSLLGTCRYVGAPGRAGPTPASTGVATSLQSLIEQTRKSAAIFTHNTLTLSSKVDVVLGARLTTETIKGSGEGRHIFDDGTTALNNRDGLGLAEGSNKISGERLTANIGLNYAINDATMAYISLSNGYKSGGFNGEVINNATHFTDDGLFGAETVNAIESGLKYSQDNLRYNFALFFQDYNNPQARIFVPFSLSGGGSFTSNSLSNLDAATSYGGEFDFNWMPITGLDLSGSVTLLDTNIDQDVNPIVPQNAAAFNGNPLPFASKYSATLMANYTWPLQEGIEAEITISGKYQSAFYLDAEGLSDRRQSGYTIIDMSAALYFDRGISVRIWGRNLNNAAYAVSGFGFIGYNKFIGAPRSYGASMKYTF